MNNNEYSCPKCGNSKYFYVEATIPCRIRFNPKTEEYYGKVYNIDKEQYEALGVVYCKECDEIVDMPSMD